MYVVLCGDGLVNRARSGERTDVVTADGVVYLWRLEVGADDGHVEPELVEDSRLLVAQVTLEGRLKVTEDGLQRVAVAVACREVKAQALRHVRTDSSRPNKCLADLDSIIQQNKKVKQPCSTFYGRYLPMAHSTG